MFSHASGKVVSAIYIIFKVNQSTEKGASVKTKQLVCHDCGCRFEIKEAKDAVPETATTEKAGKSTTKPAAHPCPECRSYNVTTA